MKKLLDNLKRIVPIYLLWIITILIVGFWSIRNLEFSPSFPYYGDLSAHYGREISSFAHFDGIHYLRLIEKGYDDTGSQAFFPVYPLLIRALSMGIFDPLYVSILFNLLCLIATLVIVTQKMPKHQVTRFLLIFLSFPASFFLIANYTESFFILLIAIFFSLLKDKKYFYASIIAAIASGTRLVGIFLGISLLIELIRNKQTLLYSVTLILISLTGLLGYIYFLFSRFGDPLMFVHVQSLFGASRSDGEIILLPQVIYRYLKILLTATPFTILYIRALLELVTFIVSIIVMYVYRHKVSFSALVFCLLALLLPTLSGTLSSFPRYALIALPLFIAISENEFSRGLWLTIIVQYGILISAIALFVQGIFIA
jgi:hypothetical protein